ncbi:T9SS type A sorting domain-containing protein [bacterium]|nr:T9SS type A sorting domain-containing protein [bacterium]MBU1983764.1 T9SS type A sorting domain-containing protein [bacterium]
MIATPNPFNPYTTISFALPHPAHARLTVYDVLGREVRVLANDNFAPGEHRLRFDGSDLPSGIYFARLQSGEFVATQKLLLLK